MNRLAPCPACAWHVRAAAIVFASATTFVACAKTEKVDDKTRNIPAPPSGSAVIPDDAAPHVAPSEPDAANAVAHGTSEPPREGPQGVVEIGPVKPTSGTMPSDLDRMMTGIRPRIRGCYIRGLVKNASMEGRVTIAVKVAATGEALEAKLTENKGLDALPAECMTAVMKKVEFSPPGGTGASFSVSITCTLKDAGTGDGGH